MIEAVMADQASPPPARGRSASDARRVGVADAPRFNRTAAKTARARALRLEATDAERRLWMRLRGRGVDGATFRRQHPAGPYVLDFFCPALRLAVEIDGGQHGEARQAARDHRRTVWLQERGVTVLRFWNNDVTQNLSGVIETIAAQVAALRAAGLSSTRRWRADLPLQGEVTPINPPLQARDAECPS
ncbi:endonuclease domain-containing protein [Blastochloris tepida]|uniref:DUF559 domain-containing protein n=1 Tax=Blastochloris tepida TaxID=2233851 RepID=A0A348G4D8_9HYPH|nr:endonuclease domain-containing protein [Blastochloris tepida]BBF94421.1 hypothetical protein BLTE_31060 [Blastochloris tepida]